MKKSHILFGVLAVLAALTLVSCKGLTTNTHETGEFSFAIDDEFIQNIARTGGSEGTYTLSAHLYTKADNSYNQRQNPTGTLAQLKNQTIEFTDIPLDKKLCLEIDISAGSTPFASTAPYVFTLGSSETRTISLKVYKEQDTPFFAFTRDEAGYYVTFASKRIASLSDFTSFQSELSPDNDSLYINLTDEDLVYVYSSCFDKDDNLWYVAVKSEQNVYYYNIYSRAAGTSGDPGDSNYEAASLHFTIEENQTLDLYPINLFYDVETDRFCLILQGYSDQDVIKVVSVPAAEFAAFNGKTDFSDLFENHTPIQLPDLIDLPEIGEYGLYANNNILYIFAYETFYKVSLEDGTTIRQNTIDLLDAIYPSNINDLYARYQELDLDDIVYINDMYVYKDKIIVLFNQELIWHPENDFYDSFAFPTTYNADDFGYICRGGILVADEETLTMQNIYGLPDINRGSYSLEAPVYIHSEASGSSSVVFRLYMKEYGSYEEYGSNDIPAFTDNTMSTQLTETYNNVGLTWSFPCINGATLCNPEKIVAIKPKKLIIADNGTFRYTDTDNPRNSERSRLVSVDLETFAITPLFECSAPYFNPYTPDGFAFTKKVQLGDEESRIGWGYQEISEPGRCKYYIFDKTNGSAWADSELFAKSQISFGDVY